MTEKLSECCLAETEPIIGGNYTGHYMCSCGKTFRVSQQVKFFACQKSHPVYTHICIGCGKPCTIVIKPETKCTCGHEQYQHSIVDGHCRGDCLCQHYHPQETTSKCSNCGSTEHKTGDVVCNKYVASKPETKCNCAWCTELAKPFSDAIHNKPDASLERLLTDEEMQKTIDNISFSTPFPKYREEVVGFIIELIKTIKVAQDSKTYPLAFEAGKKALIESEESSISVLSYRWAADAVDWAEKQKGKIVFISEAKLKELGL